MPDKCIRASRTPDRCNKRTNMVFLRTVASLARSSWILDGKHERSGAKVGREYHKTSRHGSLNARHVSASARTVLLDSRPSIDQSPGLWANSAIIATTSGMHRHLCIFGALNTSKSI